MRLSSSLTEMTGTSMLRATRSAVRWRVPVSDVGTFGFGTRCTLARAMRRELGIHEEPARADGQHLGPVTHHDEGAHVGLEDAVDPLPQRLARGDLGERSDQRGALSLQHRLTSYFPYGAADGPGVDDG